MGNATDRVDWIATIRLAAVASVLAACAALALGAYVAESTIVVGVIVLATMASWFQLEHPHPQPHQRRAVPLRHD